jgi:two-component sensor histidine kinase/DNA-binding response OmpR family regulator
MNPEPDAAQTAENHPLNVLVIEDSEDDALLMLDSLRASGYTSASRRVTTASEMREALAKPGWNLVLSDYRLPEFNALEAFAIYRDAGLDIPFIIVSGAIGEETAASAMKAGVHDYVSKANLARLAPAVRRELGEAEGRRERARARAALNAAHAELEAIQASVPALLMVANEDLSVRAANRLASSGQGIACVNYLARPEGCGQLPCPPCRIRPLVEDTLSHGTPHQNVETWIPVLVDGASKNRCFLITSVLLPSHPPKKVLICGLDVTELKHAQEELERSHERLWAANVALDLRLEELQKALNEKDVLFKEVQHRVKNNLAVISSLLSLQAGQAGSESAREALAESRDRIRSMALIHEQLCWSGHMAEIEFGQYVERLSQGLLGGYVAGRERIRVTTGIEATLPLDQAVPCGLILQELISNSLKHAFGGRAEGEIHIELRRNGAEYRLDYSDNGAGFSLDFDASRTHTLGMQLVSDLSAQLRGTMKCFNDGGARLQLTFPAATR